MPTLQPLPDCEGPKLEAFTDDLAAHDVEFLDILDLGIHSVVIKTKIDGKIYGIKFFANEYGGAPVPIGIQGIGNMLEPSPTTEEPFKLHATPFYSECRAFGRLKELGLESLAVKTHGYFPFYMTEDMKQKLQTAMGKCGRSGEAECLFNNVPEPVMAIVKDWVEGYDHSIISDVVMPQIAPLSVYFRRMLRDLHQLHRIGIVVRDLHLHQYIKGTLVDFSLAWTIPHIYGPETGLCPTWCFESFAARDLYDFQTRIIDVWNRYRARNHHRFAFPPHCTLRAYDNPEVLSRLRPRPGRQRPFLPLLTPHYAEDEGFTEELDMTQPPRYDPSKFNWREAGKKSRKVSRTLTKASTSHKSPKSRQADKRKKQGAIAKGKTMSLQERKLAS